MDRGSKDTGKDNHAWYRFDIRHKGGVRQNNRGGEAIAAQRCEECHRAYRSQRSSSRFSSETCRQRAHRKKVSVTLASRNRLREHVADVNHGSPGLRGAGVRHGGAGDLGRLSRARRNQPPSTPADRTCDRAAGRSWRPQASNRARHSRRQTRVVAVSSCFGT